MKFKSYKKYGKGKQEELGKPAITGQSEIPKKIMTGETLILPGSQSAGVLRKAKEEVEAKLRERGI